MDNPLSLTTKADGTVIAGDPKAERVSFTPGPWAYEADGKWFDVFAPNGTPICEINEAGDHSEADARLIAAAPDLYAALEDWLHYAEENLHEFDQEVCEGETLCRRCEPAGCINQKIRNARAALRLARGEQS